MNITTKILVLNSLFFLYACGEVDNTGDIEAIESMSKARAKAFNEGDAKTIASYFAEDAILMAPEKPPMKGPDKVEVYYQSIFDQYDTELSSYYDEVEVSGDLAFGRGTAEVRLKPKKGDSVITSVSKYINILQKQPNGEWLTTHDIWNNNQ